MQYINSKAIFYNLVVIEYSHLGVSAINLNENYFGGNLRILKF